jgi:hypothetical protein
LTKKPLSAASTRDALLVAGNVIASAFDVMAELQAGSELLPAAKKAFAKGKRRVRASQQLEERMRAEEDPSSSTPTGGGPCAGSATSGGGRSRKRRSKR